ncbi:MAG: hypothetical protein U0936_18535 [Planctomycetaceae bacterium]
MTGSWAISGDPNQWNAIVYNGGSIGSIDTLEGAAKFAESILEPFRIG